MRSAQRAARASMSACCVRAVLHSGLGNWLYVAAEVALVARAYNCTLVLPTVLHRWFRLPPHAQRPNAPLPCREVRSMQEASSNERTRRLAARAMGARSFEDARARMFRRLFGLPRISPPAPVRFGTSVHLRTVSDIHCHTHTDIRSCRRSCLRDEALQCVVRHALPPVLILSDSAKAGAKLRRMLLQRKIRDVWDEIDIVDARNHSALSRQAAHQTMLLWAAFVAAERRFASGVSTFSKSALLAIPHQGMRAHGGDYVVDTRCAKTHETDGNLYTCRGAVLSRDLV